MSTTSIVEAFLAYLPPDRAASVLTGASLPERAEGAVLFGDISGFTTLTEAVIERFGPRRGGEEFTNRLNAVYEALIAEVERFGGNIIGFAGDAMTVWFGGDDGHLAAATGLAMQAAIERAGRFDLPDGSPFTLRIKVALSVGELQRYAVGDPERQRIDVIAGEAMSEVTLCEGVARPHEVVLDEATARRLGDRITIGEWRDLPEGEGRSRRAGVLASLAPVVPPPRAIPPPLPEDALERLQPWLNAEIAQRIRLQQNLFLTELRPAVALFLRFTGLDFAADRAVAKKLDRFVRWVQETVDDLGGAVLQLTLGEKGNYLYAAWGAPIAHDDDNRRALTAALELSQPPPALAAMIGPVQIGVTRGTMRTGAYGSLRRRTYGVLGDDTNLAARLMMKAKPGEILVNEAVTRRQEDAFRFEPIESLQVKGRSAPVQASLLRGRRDTGLLAQLRAGYRRQVLIGRRAELATLASSLARVEAGRGEVVALSAEAGVGKTRLLAEFVQQAEDRGFTVLAGDCPVLARESSYAVWIPIWRSFFGLSDRAEDPSAVVRQLEERIAEWAEVSLERIPLLGPVLGRSLPGNALTAHLDAKAARSSREGLLITCLRRAAAVKPMLLVLDECHWIDGASRHLLAAIIQALPRSRVMVLLSHRPVDDDSILGPGEQALPYVRPLALGDLNAEEARALVALKLDPQFTGHPEVREALLDLVVARSAGNPFFIEEVLNLLRVEERDLADPDALQDLEIPDSLHSLVLGRIDQMTKAGQATLKVSSVIGRLFRLAMIYEIDPLHRDASELQAGVDEMCGRDLALPEPSVDHDAFVFRHITIQEVAYDSLPYALRAKIHEAVGLCLEQQEVSGSASNVYLLAFHFERSEQLEKKRHYLLLAGAAARGAYALATAIGYLERALPLLAGAERIPVLYDLAEVLEWSGQWDAAFARYEEARTVAEATGHLVWQARSAAAIGDFHRKRGRFDEAERWLARARTEHEQLGNEEGVAHVTHLSATLCAQQGHFDEAADRYHDALAIRERLGASVDAAKTLSNLGIVARARGDVDTALDFHRKALTLRRTLKDRREIANSLNNLGFTYRFCGDFEQARSMLEESVQMNRAIGDRWSTANALTSLAELALDTRDLALAEGCLRESVVINRDLGDLRALAFLLEALGQLERLRDNQAAAFRFLTGAQALRGLLGAPLEPADAEKFDATCATVRAALAADVAAGIEADLQARSIPELVALTDPVN